MELIDTSLYHYVWSERLWFPVSVKGEVSNTTYGWKDLKNANDSNQYYPQIRDLNLGILLGVVFVIFRYFLESLVLSPIGYWLGIRKRKPVYVEPNPTLETAYSLNRNINESKCKVLSKQLDIPQRQIEIWFRNRRKRDCPTAISKFCNNSWHLLFYTSSFIYGCIILWDRAWLWSTKECWNGWPMQHVSTDLYWYYVVELAFYCSLVLTLLTDHKRKDFTEMVIHHIATITLIYFSWISNFVRIGSLILVLHDASDPWLGMAKMGIYFKKQKLTDYSFVGFVTMWTIPRMIYYPFWIMNSTMFEITDTWNGVTFSYYFFNVFLLILFILHLVWTHRLFKMVYTTLVGGKVEDSRSDEDDDDDKEEGHEEKHRKSDDNEHAETMSQIGITKQNGCTQDQHDTNGKTNGYTCS